MTREEIMANRILPKDAVDIISDDYWMSFIPDYQEEYDEEELAQKRYISHEKIQRMPPEEVVDVLVQYHQYEVRKSDDIIKVLSVATGRTEDELRNAIFGVGDFDAMKFFQPTEQQKAVIKAVFSISVKINDAGIEWKDYKNWPQVCKDEWHNVLKDIPKEAIPSEMKDVDEYIKFYLKNGIPSWLY